jgi:hypothetical protein
VLPVYEQELAKLRQQVEEVKLGGGTKPRTERIALEPATFRLLSTDAETYVVQTGSRVFTDLPAEIQILAPELHGMTGIRFSMSEAAAGRRPAIEFEVKEAVTVLVGYVQSRDPQWRRAPELETDANAAERGGLEPLIVGAAAVDSLPPINVHAIPFGIGRHALELRGTGAFVVLGVARARAR